MIGRNFRLLLRLLGLAGGGAAVDNPAAVWMAVGISIVVLGAGLYVILSKQYSDDVQRWAFGAIGVIVGYWLA
ncbi:MAG: hypothetical protein FJ026_03230 [Chloroflexi bacterium]|nr:hypothetical protein [Chloroflexota bacterium]